MSDFDNILRLLMSYLPPFLLTSAAWIAIAVFLFSKLYHTPEKLEKWASIINRLFSWVSLGFKKRGVAGDIQADLRKTSRLINSQVSKEILPYGFKIKWVDEETRNAFVKNKEVVVRMKHHRNQAKNFMYATLSYVDFGLIPDVRHLINKNVIRAVELVFSNKIFLDNNRHDVSQIFFNEIFNKEVKKTSTLERYCNIMDGLDSNGLFTRIALKELSELEQNVPSGIPRKEVTGETVGFIKMLERLVRKRPGIDITPDYNGKFIKCSIVLVAKYEAYLLKGIRPHLNFINNSIKKGIKTFYICARGDKNISIAKEIAGAYDGSEELVITTGEPYSVKRDEKQICIILSKIQ